MIDSPGSAMGLEAVVINTAADSNIGTVPKRRGRGRPRKLSIDDKKALAPTIVDDEHTPQQPRGRGRPRKSSSDDKDAIAPTPQDGEHTPKTSVQKDQPASGHSEQFDETRRITRRLSLKLDNERTTGARNMDQNEETQANDSSKRSTDGNNAKERAVKRRKKTPRGLGPNVIDGVNVSYTLDTIPKDMVKYFHQRYAYFTKYDQGILMDKEGWFSVTPEAMAKHVAERCSTDVIIDAFCGCGGNAIQFARTCHRVIAIDIDPIKLHCARHNAKIYGVDDRIEFIQGSFYDLAPMLKADVVFLSPPWGGPTYLHEEEYNLKTMMPGNGMEIVRLAQAITPNVVFFAPKNTNPNQLALLAGPGNTCEIECNSIRQALKGLTVYYGDFLPNWDALNDLLEQENNDTQN